LNPPYIEYCNEEDEWMKKHNGDEFEGPVVPSHHSLPESRTWILLYFGDSRFNLVA